MSFIQINQELIEKVIANDQKAQFQLVDLTKRLVYSLHFRILNDEDEAQDILQYTYIEVFQQIKKLSHPDALISWMKTIIVRKAIQRSKNAIRFETLDNIPSGSK